MKSLQEFVKYFSKPILSDASFRALPKFFALQPKDYLAFSEKDLQTKDTRATVNAVGNIKRALNCRVDEIFCNWGMYKYSRNKHFSFPEKLKVLANIGILSPLVLKNINRYRNKVEHNYEEPVYEDAVDYYGTVALFVKYTDRILLTENDLGILRSESGEEYASIDIDPESSTILFSYKIDNKGSKEEKPIKGSFKIVLKTSSYDNYIRALKWWLKLVES